MKVWGVSEEEIRAAAHATGLRIYQDWRGLGISRDGRALRFRLRLDTDSRREDGSLLYQRVSQSRGGRRVASVCWHGHRDFMARIFGTNPDARIKTALADYRGVADFIRTYATTYATMYGEGNGWNLSYGQACTCGAEIDYADPRDLCNPDDVRRGELLRAGLPVRRAAVGDPMVGRVNSDPERGA